MATEIRNVLTSELARRNISCEAGPQRTKVTINLVGNSLGGLYMRFAVKELLHGGRNKKLVLPSYPNLAIDLDTFATTVSPYLGCKHMSWLGENIFPVPPKIEAAVAFALGLSVFDLFRGTETVGYMSKLDAFLLPLGSFARRVALSNAYGTDFLVGHTSGLFLSSTSQVPHRLVPSVDARGEEGREKAHVSAIYETSRTCDPLGTAATYPSGSTGNPEDSFKVTDCQASQNLDGLGWKKIVVDMRRVLGTFGGGKNQEEKDLLVIRSKARLQRDYTSQELNAELRLPAGGVGVGMPLPRAHNMAVANQKNAKYTEAYQAGRPVMDWLAKEIVLGGGGGREKVD